MKLNPGKGIDTKYCVIAKAGVGILDGVSQRGAQAGFRVEDIKTFEMSIPEISVDCHDWDGANTLAALSNGWRNQTARIRGHRELQTPYMSPTVAPTAVALHNMHRSMFETAQRAP